MTRQGGYSTGDTSRRLLTWRHDREEAGRGLLPHTILPPTPQLPVVKEVAGGETHQGGPGGGACDVPLRETLDKRS